MAKGAYIGVPSYDSEFDGNVYYDPTYGQWKSQIVMDASTWVKGTTYVYNVEINGVVYRDMNFLPDVGASWITYDESGELFDLMVGVGGWIYLNDYGLGLDTSAPCIIRIYTGEPVSVARKVKSGYVGVPTNVAVYEETVSDTTITASNIEEFFTVTNGASYYFKGNGGTFTSNNAGYDSTTATSTWTAKVDMSSVSLSYSVSSESNYDKLTIKIGDTTVANTISGNLSGTGTGSLTKGQTIQLTYSKDSSNGSGNDCGTISNIIVTCEKKTLVGTEMRDVARKIKKAYIGIGGVARPCWGGGGLEYFGTIADLSIGRRNGAATSIGNYALFGGGVADGNTYATSRVDVYDSALTKQSNKSFTYGVVDNTATTVGDYAIFAGGYAYDSSDDSTWITNNAYAFNSSLTMNTSAYLGTSRRDLASASVGNYAIFAGGSSSGTTYAVATCQTISNTLTRGTAPTLMSDAYGLAATSVGDYAIFSGGKNGSGSLATTTAYSSSLTRIETVTGLSVGRYDLYAARTNNYAIFTGGVISTSTTVATGTVYESSNVADAYDASLTRVVAGNMSAARFALRGCSVDGKAIFAGGSTISINAVTNAVDCYDDSLTVEVLQNLSEGRYDLFATSVGNYAIFAGGCDGTKTSSGADSDNGVAKVEVYVAS